MLGDKRGAAPRIGYSLSANLQVGCPYRGIYPEPGFGALVLVTTYPSKHRLEEGTGPLRSAVGKLMKKHFSILAGLILALASVAIAQDRGQRSNQRQDQNNVQFSQ